MFSRLCLLVREMTSESCVQFCVLFVFKVNFNVGFEVPSTQTAKRPRGLYMVKIKISKDNPTATFILSCSSCLQFYCHPYTSQAIPYLISTHLKGRLVHGWLACAPTFLSTLWWRFPSQIHCAHADAHTTLPTTTHMLSTWSQVVCYDTYAQPKPRLIHCALIDQVPENN